MNVAVIPSTLESESFVVSAVEAQVCGTAVIVSDVPGLMEATKPGETSVIVHRNNPSEIASKIYFLAQHEKNRKLLGENGCKYVNRVYEINSCFETIERLFRKMI